MEGQDPTEFSLTEKIAFLAQGITSGKIFELAKPMNASLWKQFAGAFSHSDFKESLARETAGIAEPERRAFIIANLLANQVAYRIFTKFVKELSSGKLIESIQDISTLAPIALALAPYFYAFRSQTPDRRWLFETVHPIRGRVPAALQNHKRAWFTDTLEDVNGVANTIRRMTAAGIAAGKDITVVTSRTEIKPGAQIPIKNFQPIGEFEMPEYELQKLSFPPVLQMMDYIQREKFTELIISTPGPVGLTALIAAKTLGLRTSGIYHTDFPQYVGILTDDRFLGDAHVDFHALVLLPDGPRLRELRALPPLLDRPRHSRGKTEDLPARPRYHPLPSRQTRRGHPRPVRRPGWRTRAPLRRPHLQGKGPGCPGPAPTRNCAASTPPPASSSSEMALT